MKIIEIDNNYYSEVSEDKIFAESEVPIFYYKVAIGKTELFFSSSFNKDYYIIERTNNDYIFCLDNRVGVVNESGRILLSLPLFERFYIHRKIKNNFFLFSERTAFKFSYYDYTVENMIWLSDLLQHIHEEESGFAVSCVDGIIHKI